VLVPSRLKRPGPPVPIAARHAGEWLIEKHGSSRRRSWRKLHLGFDADSREIVAVELTRKAIYNGSRTGALLDQIADPVAMTVGSGCRSATS